MSADGAPRDTGALVRRVRLDRVQALFDRWRALDQIDAPEALGLERALLTALARDRELFSDVFEASFAITQTTEHAYRFSYAFPGFRARAPSAPSLPAAPSAASLPGAPAAVSRRADLSRAALSPSPAPLSAPAPARLAPMAAAAVTSALACAAPFGPAVVAATRRLLRAATDPVVEQPLIGLAWDRAGAPRHKVYLQLRDDGARALDGGRGHSAHGRGGEGDGDARAAPAAFVARALDGGRGHSAHGRGGEGDGDARAAPAFAERVLGMPGLAVRIGDAHLHMVGIDFGPAGLTAAKLYIAHESLVATDPAAAAGPAAPGCAASTTVAPSGSAPPVAHSAVAPSEATLAAAPSTVALASIAPATSSTTALAAAALGRVLPAGHLVRNVLTVHRVTPADVVAGCLPPPTDVDFGLADNDLSWEQIAGSPEIAALLARSRVASALFGGFRIGIRRISVGTGPALRLTVYYGLREVEEP